MAIDLSYRRGVVLDGGTGSELQRRGVRVSDSVWTAHASVGHFDTLVAIHTDYARAGADVITANTFATNRFVLAAEGLDDRFFDINSAAVAAAKEAASSVPQKIAVAGSISCLPPRFDTRAYPDEDQEIAGYTELAETLASLGVDLLLLEMMQDTLHAQRALDAASATGLPVWLGLSCRREQHSRKLIGFDFPDNEFVRYATHLVRGEPAVVNVMHTPCADVAAALQALKILWSGPVGAYPEVGSFDPVSRKRSTEIGPATLAAYAAEWYQLGARVLGGCCGAGPAHVRQLREMVDSMD